MWRGCVGGMVLSKCAIREKCAIFSKKAPAFWLTGAELFICFLE